MILKNVYEEGLKHSTKFFTFNKNIMNKIKSGITGTSANLSGKIHSLDNYKIIKDLGTKVDIFVFGNYKVKNKKPSTILDVTSDKMKIIREGAIKKADIDNINF